MSTFINQSDPTLPLDLRSVTLEQQYSKLTEQDKLLVFCKLHGYDRVPPTVEQLYTDLYYLGGTEFFDEGKVIYDFWKESFPTIFPTAVTTAKPFLVLSGAIGIGKSTVSRIAMAETYARLLCMINPSRTLGLAKKPLSFVIVGRQEEMVTREFKYWFKYEVLEKSPFFRSVKPRFNLQIFTSGPTGGNSGLGSDVIYYCISEVNFYPNQEKAQSIVETAYGRFTSRFDKAAYTKAGCLILDSSATGSASVTNWFLENAPEEYLWNCKPTHYDVKRDSYKESGGKTFSVYTGDGKYPATILPEDYRLEPDQDPDRVMKVPIQLRIEANQNLIKMLQDKCGVSTSSVDSFFGGTVQAMTECSNIPNRVPEILIVDFYDKEDRLINHLTPALDEIPYRSTIWLGLDLATTDDFTGLSAVQFDGWEVISGVKYPKIKVIFSVAIGRKDGQETSLFHIFNFIMDLKKNYNVIVSADQAYSKQILQDCEREGIVTNGRISTDLVPCQPALYLKSQIMLGLIQIPHNRRLLREAFDLKYVPTSKGFKVDHPKKATINTHVFDANNGKGSKDVWDSLSSACYSLKMSIDSGEEDGYSNGITKQLNLVTQMTTDVAETASQVVQNMIEDIF